MATEGTTDNLTTEVRLEEKNFIELMLAGSARANAAAAQVNDTLRILVGAIKQALRRNPEIRNRFADFCMPYQDNWSSDQGWFQWSFDWRSGFNLFMVSPEHLEFEASWMLDSKHPSVTNGIPAEFALCVRATLEKFVLEVRKRIPEIEPKIGYLIIIGKWTSTPSD